MQVEFTPHRPEGSRLIAHVADKGKLPGGLERPLAQGAKAARFEGRAGQVFDSFVERDGAVVRVAIAGAGDPASERRVAHLERAGSALAGRFQSGVEEALALDASGLSASELASVLLGLRLRNWRWDAHRTIMKEEHKVHLKRVTVFNAPDGGEDAWRDGAALAEGVEFTRELVSEPANLLYPESFVARVRERFEGTGVEITVLGEAEMEKLGMGSLLGVGQGSRRESQLLALRWNGGAAGEAPTAFVGKGVTFDTGGISIKPAEGMERMKDDMAGGASVVAAMRAIALLGGPHRVIGVVPMAENMPGGRAIRPGDVLTSAAGKTVEVINTDAEGRLILADALWYAANEGATHLVDVATLTGAIVVALGRVRSGLFGHPDSWRDAVVRAADAAGDRVWPMPTDDDYFEPLKSEIADMMNVGGRPGGAITAAMFLKQFAAGRPWAHLDIAATAWAEEAKPWQPKGATSVAVRTLVELAMRAPLATEAG